MSYRKGRRNEYRVAEWLHRRGWWIVRAAGSAGLFDLIGVKRPVIAFIQVKTGRWPLQEEMKRIIDFRDGLPPSFWRTDAPATQMSGRIFIYRFPTRGLVVRRWLLPPDVFVATDCDWSRAAALDFPSNIDERTRE